MQDTVAGLLETPEAETSPNVAMVDGRKQDSYLDDVWDAPQAFHVLHMLHQQGNAALEERADCVRGPGPKLHLSLGRPHNAVIR